MAKLSFERDLKPLLKEVNGIYEEEFKMRDIDSGTWRIMADGELIIEGTLRECYCFLKGILFATD